MKNHDFKKLLKILEEIISRNRDLLSVKDLNDLEKCLKIMRSMDNFDKENSRTEYLKYAVEFIISLIKFFS